MAKTLQEVIADAVTRIAQQACRNGESDNRTWPPLAELPFLESWKMIGDRYAPEIIAEIAKLAYEDTMNQSVAKDVEIIRAMQEQGVINSLALQGPLGDALRTEAKPHLEALVAKGVVSPTIWKLYEK
jgi:hypothetical protein